MNKKQTPVVIYHDEANEDFSKPGIKTRVIDGAYKYRRENVFARLFSFLLYRVIMYPFCFFLSKSKFHHKIINRKILKGYKKKAFLIYGNHTQPFADTYIPSFINFPKKTFFIVHPNNVSMKFQGKLNPYLGAIPLPNTLQAVRHYDDFLDYCINKNRTICIYPERNLWPECSFIRTFDKNSFRYQIKYDIPSFCFTNVYKRRKPNSLKYDIITYVDGPFFADKSINDINGQKEDLCKRIRQTMVDRSQMSDISPIIYKKAQ